MKVSVVIPTYNRKIKLARLIKTILKSDFPKNSYEVLVIDDCSTDGTVDYIRRLFIDIKNLKVIGKKKNTRKSNSVNLGFKNAKGDYIFFIDDDTTVDKNTIRVLYEYLTGTQEKVMVFPLMYYYDRKDVIWSGGLRLNFWTTYGKFLLQGVTEELVDQDTIEVDAGVTAFMVPREIYREIGGFNNLLFPFQFEEIDYCVRALHAGYKLVTLTHAKLWHDHEYGVFLNNPWRLYYEVRNRIVSSKLWGVNRFQRLVAGSVSLIVPLSYIFIKLLFFRQKYFEALLSIFRGTRDGIKMKRRLVPYSERKVSTLKVKVLLKNS